MVEIPQTLINKLAPLGPHFIRVAKHGKQALDDGWPQKPLEANDPKLQEWLKENGNYGVVTGFGLTVVEIDIPELQEIAKTKLPETFTVLSPGHQGWHLYYVSSLDKPIRLRDEKGESVGEVQGPGKMVLGPGSVHPNGKVYKIVNDRPLAQVTRQQLVEALKPWVIPDKETDLVEALARQERKQSNIDLNILQVVPLAGLHRQGNEYYGPHPVHGSDTGHNFWVNPSKNCWHCFRHKTGGGPLLWLAVEEGIIRCEDAGPGVLRGEVFKQVFKVAIEKGYIKNGETEKPKKTRKVEAEKEEKKKQVMKDSGQTTDGCFEAIYHDGKPMFLVKNSESFSIVESLEVNGEEFIPKDVKHVPYEPYGYFEGSTPQLEDLFWKVRNELEIFVDVESIWKDVLAACVLLSYQQEKLQTVPYIFLYGDNESGKSTVLQVLKFLCYRPMSGVTIPSADLYGYLEDSDSISTILEDEIQGVENDLDKTKIYKAGYKQGAVVPRMIATEHDRIIKYYQTFCFKACASEQIPVVKGFRERFIEIPMVEGYPQKEWADVTREDLERLRNLRNMLLKWRMLVRTEELPNVEVPLKGRIKELWKPLLQVTHGLTVYDTLFKFVEEQRKERLSVKQDTLEGHVVKMVVEILNEAKDQLEPIPFSTIWDALVLDLNGKVNPDKPNVMDTSEFFDVSKNKVGYRLREVLSGKSKVKKEKQDNDWVNYKAYEFNLDKVRRVAKKYGYELATKLPSLLSSGGVQGSSVAEKPENNGENNVESMEKTAAQETGTPLELGKLSNLVANPLNAENLVAKPTYVYKHVLPGEPCELCGQLAVEWQIKTPQGQVLRRCNNCFVEMRKNLTNADWREETE
jgi:hypothetical protein